MLEIHKITVPTLYPIGPVNCYMVKNRPYTLVDPGPKTAEAKKALLDGLASLGLTPADIARVVITHSHSDHSGLARWLGETAGAAVYVHRLEVRKLAFDYDFYQEKMHFLKDAGLPFEVLKEIQGDRDLVVKSGLPRSWVVALEGGEELEFEGGSLRVMHLPGHSSGHICLYEPESKIFLAGDFILKHIISSPSMEVDPADFTRRIPTLAQYMEGLKVMEELDIDLIMPGHGENIDDSRKAAARAQTHYARRLEEVCSILEGNSLSAYQIMRLLYPGLRGFQAFLGISAVFTHLDYLRSLGKVSMERRGEVSFFSLG